MTQKFFFLFDYQVLCLLILPGANHGEPYPTNYDIPSMYIVRDLTERAAVMAPLHGLASADKRPSHQRPYHRRPLILFRVARAISIRNLADRFRSKNFLRK